MRRNVAFRYELVQIGHRLEKGVRHRFEPESGGLVQSPAPQQTAWSGDEIYHRVRVRARNQRRHNLTGVHRGNDRSLDVDDAKMR